MNSLTNAIIFLVLTVALTPTFLHDTHNLVSANDELTRQQCHHTETPELCIQCIKSHPEAEINDEIGVAITLTCCLSNHSRNLKSNMSMLALITKDKILKPVFEDCRKKYTDSLKDLSKVASYLKGKNYDYAGASVSSASSYHFSCVGNILRHKWNIPSAINYEMIVFGDVCEATMRIIDRF